MAARYDTSASLYDSPPATFAFGVLAIITCIVLYALSNLRHRTTKSNAIFWASIPTAGVPENTFLPWLRAGIRSISNTEIDANDGYQKFCKVLDSPFAIPNAGAGTIVVLPPSQLRRVLSRPVTEVEAWRAQLDTLQPRYMIPRQGKGVFTEDEPHPAQFAIVRRHMTRPEDIRGFAPIVAEELRAALADCWNLPHVQTGADEAQIIPLWDSCSRIVSRITFRVFVGAPLCRDEELLEKSRLYADAMYGGAAAITALPKIIRPVIGPLVALPSRKYLAGCNKILVPFVEQRLRIWSGGKGDAMPNDALQWIIQESSRSANFDAVTISQRLLMLNLVSIFSTTYHLANCLLDILYSPSRDSVLAGLKAECDAVSSANDGCLDTKEAIDQLYRMDSTVRESLRVSASNIIAMPRIVARGSGGLDINHMVVPEGVRLGAPLRAIHHDPAYYDQPHSFDAFRFSRPFEGPEGRGRQAAEQKQSCGTDETFLSFGYGKHGCPGRWFATQTIKQALAHIVQMYDIECIGQRPAKDVLLNTVMPPTKAHVSIRRRQMAGASVG